MAQVRQAHYRRFLVVGDTHGNLDLLFKKWREVTRNGLFPVDAILSVGDFGFWPKPVSGKEYDLYVKHNGSPPDQLWHAGGYIGDFYRYAAEERRVPIDTYSIRGNHEDQIALRELEQKLGVFHEPRAAEILPRLWYIPDGAVVEIAGVKVAGLGGNYGTSSWDKPYTSFSRKLKHSTFDRLELLARRNFDVLLTHDAPAWVGLEDARRNKGISPGNPYIRDLIEQRQPAWAFFGHYHVWHEARIGRTQIRGLRKLGPDTYSDANNHFIVEL